MTLTVGSLFSGIGGLDLGLERAGMKVIWQSEIDPYACKVLAKHWKDVPNHGNIKEINWGDVVRPDVICGGYPCQPFSTAGKRNGTDDPRHLFPWVREAISVLRPRYAILENVRGHVSLGLDIVLREMASIGYDAEWQLVSASSVGAPHRRDRLVIIAYPGTDTVRKLADSDRFGHIHGKSEIFTRDRWLHALNYVASGGANVGNPDVERWQRSSKLQEAVTKRSGLDKSSPTRGWSSIWESEPNVGRVAHGIPSRVDKLRGLGNAVVPQVAELVGRMVIDYDNQ